jgi:GrpB-like predicted nucleotidyltransferase (UPF0157 family)
MSVEVVNYNPDWKKWFTYLKYKIWPHISDIAIDIIHVGSTSIKGMSSKPIIDMDIVIDNLDCLPKLKNRLKNIGYSHIGDLGIKNREVFNNEYPDIFPHHLYVCLQGSLPLKNHILVKKHLNENSEAFREYNDLKINLANSGLTREQYTRSKTSLITSFLIAEGLTSEEISQIIAENLQ